jgi:hypothetical protein
MSGDRRSAALPASFSLLKSEFNDFLFAPVGGDDDHRVLSVLSAFSRAGIDPWRKAAQLQGLPREQAMQDLASILAALPDSPRPLTEARFAAHRLIALLPRRLSLQARVAAASRRCAARLSHIAFRGFR